MMHRRLSVAASALLAITLLTHPARGGIPKDEEDAKLAAALEGLRSAEQRPRTGTLRWKSEYVLAEDAGMKRFATAKIVTTGIERDLADAWRVDVRRKSWEPADSGPIDAWPADVEREAAEPKLEEHVRRNVSCYDGIRTLRATYPHKDARYPDVELLEGNVPSRHRLNLYMLHFNSKRPRTSLSKWLALELGPGDESFTNHGDLWTPRYLRTELIDGLETHVVAAEYRDAYQPDGPPVAEWRFYLAPERDYLPIRAEYRPRGMSTDFPIETVVLSELARSTDGRWFPRRSVHQLFSVVAARERGVKRLTWTTTYTMDWRPDELIDRADLRKDTAPKGGWPGASEQGVEEVDPPAGVEQD